MANNITENWHKVRIMQRFELPFWIRLEFLLKGFLMFEITYNEKVTSELSDITVSVYKESKTKGI
jgi:hypothetical protein